MMKDFRFHRYEDKSPLCVISSYLYKLKIVVKLWGLNLTKQQI